MRDCLPVTTPPATTTRRMIHTSAHHEFAIDIRPRKMNSFLRLIFKRPFLHTKCVTGWLTHCTHQVRGPSECTYSPTRDLEGIESLSLHFRHDFAGRKVAEILHPTICEQLSGNISSQVLSYEQRSSNYKPQTDLCKERKRKRSTSPSTTTTNPIRPSLLSSLPLPPFYAAPLQPVPTGSGCA